MAHDLLVEPLLSWRDGQGQRRKATLPGILACLASSELTDFPRLRTHHLHPWCMFLAQLAAIALYQSGRTDPRLPEDEWRQLLQRLTDGQHEPWSLVIEDLSKPAFFQPPVPERKMVKWQAYEHPDDLDVLVTTKGHDVKTGLMRGDEPETWLYALVALQTMQGYPGRGYNRMARMKGGYGNRPRVGLARDHTLSARFVRDVDVMLHAWPEIVERRGFNNTGLALVWTEPWDGRTSLSTDRLAPHFIEVCWRLRCIEHAAHIRCLYTTTHERRCLADDETGDVGDSWIPVARSDRGALTVGPKGFHYELLTKILFETEFAPAAAQTQRPDDGEAMLFLASAMARGQGKTEGLHERTLMLTREVRWRMGSAAERPALGERAVERVGSAARMRSKVLFPALKQLARGGQSPQDALDARVNEMFFDHLFGTIDKPDEDARLAFERKLHALAASELERAIAGIGTTGSHRFRAISDAERMFRSCARKHFPDVFAQATNSDE